jgi:hypothetical protein
MYRRILLPLVCLIAVPCLAQTADSSSALPVLISDTNVVPGDSRLVAAAKTVVAARMRSQTHAAVLDNRQVAGSTGVISQSSGRPIAGLSGSSPNAAPVSRPKADPSYARAVEQKRQNLKNEQHVMAEEHDQPYGGDIPEDRTVQRMTEIPKEIDRLPTVPPPPPHE